MPVFGIYKGITYTISIYPDQPIPIEPKDVFESATKGAFPYPYMRPRVTRVLRSWSLPYRYLPAADQAILESLFLAINYSDIFSWYDYIKNTYRDVHLEGMPKFSFMGSGFYHTDIVIREV